LLAAESAAGFAATAAATATALCVPAHICWLCLCVEETCAEQICWQAGKQGTHITNANIECPA